MDTFLLRLVLQRAQLASKVFKPGHPVYTFFGGLDLNNAELREAIERYYRLNPKQVSKIYHEVLTLTRQIQMDDVALTTMVTDLCRLEDVSG